MSRQRWTRALIVGVAVFGGAMCDSDNPVAPSRTVITVSATPPTINLNQTSTVTVTGFRPDGNPLAPSTPLSLSTTLGVLSQQNITTDDNGTAVATLTPNGQTGTAIVTVKSTEDTSILGRAEVEITAVPATPTAPAFSKEFLPDSILTGEISVLTFTIDNTANAESTTDLTFTDTFPADLVVAPIANASTSCAGGTLTAIPGSGSVSYSGGTVVANCTVSVDVTSAVENVYINTTENLTSSAGNSGAATNQLIVQAPAQIDGVYGPGRFTLVGQDCMPPFFGAGFDGTATLSNTGTVLVIGESEDRTSVGSFTNGLGTFVGAGSVGPEPAGWVLDVEWDPSGLTPFVAVRSEQITLTNRGCSGEFMSEPLPQQ